MSIRRSKLIKQVAQKFEAHQHSYHRVKKYRIPARSCINCVRIIAIENNASVLCTKTGPAHFPSMLYEHHSESPLFITACRNTNQAMCTFSIRPKRSRKLKSETTKNDESRCARRRELLRRPLVERANRGLLHTARQKGH